MKTTTRFQNIKCNFQKGRAGRRLYQKQNKTK